MVRKRKSSAEIELTIISITLASSFSPRIPEIKIQKWVTSLHHGSTESKRLKALSCVWTSFLVSILALNETRGRYTVFREWSRNETCRQILAVYNSRVLPTYGVINTC